MHILIGLIALILLGAFWQLALRGLVFAAIGASVLAVAVVLVLGGIWAVDRISNGPHDLYSAHYGAELPPYVPPQPTPARL